MKHIFVCFKKEKDVTTEREIISWLLGKNDAKPNNKNK